MLEIPPLAQRREDIPLLANHFLALSRRRHNSEVNGFSPESMELLVGAPWPGNVRQLLNVVEQLSVLSTTPIVPASLVQRALRDKPTEILSLGEARERFEREYLVQILRITEGNVSQAARLAQRNRTEFYKLLKRHQLDPELFRAECES
jgi:two-component system response regulator GlrR